MKKLREFAHTMKEYGVFWAWITAIVSVGLIITSFILPPTGVIDASVFAGVGELLAVKVICFDLADMVTAGYRFKYKDIITAEKSSVTEENSEDKELSL